VNESSANLLTRDREAVWHPFTQHGLGQIPLPVTSATGAVIRDAGGKEYLDMISSWWVNLHGHGRPELAEAVREQILRLDHVQFAGATHEPAVTLAEELLETAGLSGKARVFYSDNGSTAVEVALKIACQYRGQPHNGCKPLFATLEGAYHGDTVGAMSVGRSSGFFGNFGSMMFETIALPVPLVWKDHRDEEEEASALREARELLEREGSDLCGLIVEPLVQGAGGMRFHSASFLRELCQLFRDHSVPVIFDEVMTGFGRTGSFYAFQQTGFLPDLICLSKGITGGILPLAATLATNGLFDSFLGKDFSTALAHGHSYTANPVACAAAVASMSLHRNTDSAAQVRRIHDAMEKGLGELSSHPLVSRTRLLGGIAAFDLGSTQGYTAPIGRRLAERALEQGLLIRPLGNVVYLIPPYCATDSEIGKAFRIILGILPELASSP
jgi:adenosylmethionine-8-amino-7-oxononanoate aminotransferase